MQYSARFNCVNAIRYIDLQILCQQSNIYNNSFNLLDQPRQMSAPRLNKERQELQKQGYNVIAEADTLWKIFIKGPTQTPFQNGQFQIEFKLDNFPFKGPIVSFKTKIYHPNVNNQGQICADMLQTGDKWAPTKKLVKVMDKIKSLMVAPNLDTPMNPEAANDYKNNTWQNKAKNWTNQYAK